MISLALRCGDTILPPEAVLKREIRRRPRPRSRAEWFLGWWSPLGLPGPLPERRRPILVDVPGFQLSVRTTG